MAKADPDSPRFQSDKEDGDKEEKQRKEFVAAKLDLVEQTKGLGIDVDRRMVQGRRNDRGFTISVGARTVQPEEEDDQNDKSGQNPARSTKRAQTLPASSTRRSDYILSADAQQKLTEGQQAFMARIRRGSIQVAGDNPTDEQLTEFFKECLGHSHGLMTDGQQHGDERERVAYGSGYPGPLPVIVACQKGSKGFRDTTPNQDNFSLTYFKDGYNLACAFDGHGPWGHLVSTRTVQTVPYYFHKSVHYPSDIEKAFIEAFTKAHSDIVNLALTDGWDIQASGSTAVAACWKGDEIWTANCGDSRCVVGSELDKSLLFETTDHKPDTPDEKARIEASGGEVRTQTYPDGWVNHRIFVKGEDYPGLCMARTLGDQSVKDHGVIPDPEVVHTKMDMGKQPFFILSSDGVWEFLDSQFVVKAVAKKIKTDGAEKTIQKLQREAKKRWKQEEGDYCDDITSILVQLRG